MRFFKFFVFWLRKILKTASQSNLKVPLGSALIFNGKINHRGKANGYEKERPALYLVYHKKWYNDQYRKGILKFFNAVFKRYGVF